MRRNFYSLAYFDEDPRETGSRSPSLFHMPLTASGMTAVNRAAVALKKKGSLRLVLPTKYKEAADSSILLFAFSQLGTPR